MYDWQGDFEKCSKSGKYLMIPPKGPANIELATMMWMMNKLAVVKDKNVQIEN